MFRVKKNISVPGEAFISSPVAIEQFAAKEFFNNAAGWHKNDIAAIAACTTQEQYNALLSSLQMNDPKFDVKDGDKIADSIRKIVPRWCQSPSEIQNFAEGYASKQLDDAYNEALKDVELKKEDPAFVADPPSDAPVEK